MQEEIPTLSISKWKTLPANRRNKLFWQKLIEYLNPLLDPEFPLMNDGFRHLSGGVCSSPLAHNFISESLLDVARDLRGYFEDVSLWNPLSLAAHLDLRPADVIEQLLLGREFGLVSMKFVFNCASCGCDMLHLNSVSDLCFRPSFHKSNVTVCPMCTERNELTSMGQVAVYFQDVTPPPILNKMYHRLFSSGEACRRRLSSVFCPQGAAFSFAMKLPEGSYLLIASGLGLIVQLDVALGAQFVERNRPHHEVTLLLAKLMGKKMGKGSAEEDNQKRTVIKAKHGKLSFRVFNDTEFASYMDICIAFDERLEFLAIKKPVITTIPMILHFSTRGFRSPLFPVFIPAPPGAKTDGVYVIHSFAFQQQSMEDVMLTGGESTVAIVREVHRYSLEDHKGLLLSVGLGGATYESTFLSFTAALASSLSFAQRLVTRLGQEVAGGMSCSITSGELYMASFKGQYDDDENERSAYPSVHFAGPAVYAGTHPPVVSGEVRIDSEMEPRYTSVRFELREASEDGTGTRLSPKSVDKMLDGFLAYIKENLVGVVVSEEDQALVVVVPIETLNAEVKLASLVDFTTYTSEIHGPFG